MICKVRVPTNWWYTEDDYDQQQVDDPQWEDGEVTFVGGGTSDTSNTGVVINTEDERQDRQVTVNQYNLRPKDKSGYDTETSNNSKRSRREK